MRLFLLCFFSLTLTASAAAAPPSLDDFLRRDSFEDIRISPDGTYLAATVPLDGSNALIVLRRDTLERTSVTKMPEHNYVDDVRWVDSTRVMFSANRKFGQLEDPQSTGELFIVRADQQDSARILAGVRAQNDNAGSHMRKDEQRVYAELVSLLPAEENEVLVAITDPAGRSEVARMSLKNGRRHKVIGGPMLWSSFVADAHGQPRFAIATDQHAESHTYYRAPDQDDWREVNNQHETGRVLTPIGFLAGSDTAIVQVSRSDGPDQVARFDPATGAIEVLLADPEVNPFRYLYAPDDHGVYGVVFMADEPRVEYLDPKLPLARLHASFAANFPHDYVLPTSYGREAGLGLYLVANDRNPGDYYLVDRDQHSAKLLLSRAEWLYPDDMATTRSVHLKARDGLALTALLTVPHGREAKDLPLIVNPHGGPFRIFDDTLFQSERQLLASRGYAVLQVNFRGSGNRGDQFELAGYKQWGGTMQDDVTDATRWAIEQGIADPKRICIYGGSYGGYAALMGVAREPELYRCAAGNVGVYDLPLLYTDGDIDDLRWGHDYLEATLGRDDLEARSPVNLADRIVAPVFLAAGAEDERAPARHSREMRNALKKAGHPAELKVYAGEGHGLFLAKNRKDYYTRLLAFFDRYIGAGAGAAVAAGSD